MIAKRWFGARLLAVVCSVFVAGCVANGARSGDSLYVALGQKPGIERLVDALLDRCYSDRRIAFLFKDADRPDLTRLINEQFCAESGGPCVYTGRSMTEAHSGLSLKQKEFDAFVEDLILGMEDVGLPYRTQNRMLAIFAPMRPDVIDQ